MLRDARTQLFGLWIGVQSIGLHTENWFPELEKEDIYRDGGWESFESYKSCKITLEKVMNEGEGRKMLEVLYKSPTANFASEGLDASQSIYINNSFVTL
jgi:hypothetical protein